MSGMSLVLCCCFFFTYKSTGILRLTGWFNRRAQGWGDMMGVMSWQVIHMLGEIRLWGEKQRHIQMWKEQEVNKSKINQQNRKLYEEYTHGAKWNGHFHFYFYIYLDIWVRGGLVIYTWGPVISHPIVERMLRAGHSTEVGAVGLRRQRPGKGGRRRADGRGLAVPRLWTGQCLLQGQRGIGHSSHVDLLPGRTHI